MLKKLTSLLFVFLTLVAASASFAGEYPERNINGYIVWGAGGVTDNVSRALASLAEKELGVSIIMQNKTGASGAIATTYVHNAPADGYSLLFGAENQGLYKVMNLSQIDYDEFIPLLIAMGNTGVVCVSPSSPYATYKDFIDAAQGEKKFSMGSTGPGGFPYVASCMMTDIHKGIRFNFVQFDGEAGALTALMGGHIDAVPVGLLSAAELIKGNKIRALAVLADKRLPQFPDLPAITEFFPEYERYLPWEAFYGVFIKKGTPDDIVNKLKDAFIKASQNPVFDKLAENLGGTKLALTGQDARTYVDKNRSVAAWLMQRAGAAKKSPAEFGIPEP